MRGGHWIGGAYPLVCGAVCDLRVARACPERAGRLAVYLTRSCRARSV